MSNGIIGKVWNIKGETLAKGVKGQLRDSVSYILNDEKTNASVELNPFNQLMRECKYVENDIKTFAGAYVGGNNIISTDVGAAVEEMMQVKNFYGKQDGRAALHLLISLSEEESSVENAPKLMELCDRVLKELFPNNQAIYAVHTNTDNLHIHCIVNSVGLDGRKIHQKHGFVETVLHPCINKYAAMLGFQQNEKWMREVQEKKQEISAIKAKLRKEIDLAIETSDSFEAFVEVLRKSHISVRTGKYISLKLPDMGKAMRTYVLGTNYTRDAIVERLAIKKVKFSLHNVGDYTVERREDIFIPDIFEMKKFKDMTDEQKKKVVHQLKLGKNPWRENRQLNWQLNSIADELNSFERIQEYVSFYSKDGTLQGALDGIIEAKKRVSHDKKMVTYAKRKYKPILEIYEKMKQIERRAWLYEHQNVQEFRTEFESYRDYTRRLRTAYNKDIFEVASFLQECDERLLYAHAQLNELSHEYREIKAYQKEKHFVTEEKRDLVGILNYYGQRKESRQGSFEADAFFIASSDAGTIVRVVKTPAVDEKGRTYEEYEIAAFNKNGSVIDILSNREDDFGFANQLKAFQKKYCLTDCREFQNFQNAKEYAASRNRSDNVIVGTETEHEVSFTQAINHVNESKTMNVLVDIQAPSFIILSTLEKQQLKIIVLDRQHKIMETKFISMVKDKNSSGFKDIVEFQKKYGFSDHVKECSSISEADSVIKQKGLTQEFSKIRK